MANKKTSESSIPKSRSKRSEDWIGEALRTGKLTHAPKGFKNRPRVRSGEALKNGQTISEEIEEYLALNRNRKPSCDYESENSLQRHIHFFYVGRDRAAEFDGMIDPIEEPSSIRPKKD